MVNEAELSLVELNRLQHWRYGHRNPTGKRHKERCPTCEQAKQKRDRSNGMRLTSAPMHQNKDATGGYGAMPMEGRGRWDRNLTRVLQAATFSYAP